MSLQKSQSWYNDTKEELLCLWGVRNSTRGRRHLSPSRCHQSERQTGDTLLPGIKSLLFSPSFLPLGFGPRAPFLSRESSHFCVTIEANLPWFSCLILSHLGCGSFYLPVPKLGCVSQCPAAFLLLYSKACLLNSAPGIRRIQRMLWKRE